MVVFWAIVVGSVMWFVASLRRRGDADDALEVLRRRLARGEIDVDEFQRREGALTESARPKQFPLRALAIAAAVVVGALIILPAIVMTANGWDMWDMHGRGRNTSTSAVVQGGTQASVRIEDFAFEPGNLEVPVGATVTWRNEDSVPHDATARNADWKTELLSDSDSDTLTFDGVGEYDYYCSIHPSMKARIVVR
jgi:plastocyanin